MSANERIAIVGMAGRFPGAPDLETFWRNLRDGVESIARFTPDELRDRGISADLLRDQDYVPANGVLADVELFDAAFFGFTPREAELTDPQHRVFLECAWQALEDAGYDADRVRGQIAVYAGAGLSTYLLHNLARYRDDPKAAGDVQLLLGNHKDFVATRVSYKLNLRGPSVNVGTACSTSLVAVHMACQSLLDFECDMALAGGVSIQVPQEHGYLYLPGGISSPDGHCRAFDARARGTVGGNGAGVVVLKRLSDAIDAGDDIRAVILGSAINNDGGAKVGFTAPAVQGQADAIAQAQAAADVPPESISYVEAHGTGTPLGDPIEIAALTQAFGPSSRQVCAIGSVKTNVGHLDDAAGAAGLIKTVLALQHRQIPPSLHFERPNPDLRLEESPFFVNASLREWASRDGPRRAGVSSFGIGGTNAHVVLEEAPPRATREPSRPWQLIVLSARSAGALDAASANLARHLEAVPAVPLADIAHTLQAGRKAFEHRRAVVCRDATVAREALRSTPSHRAAASPSVAFLFSGQGAQYVDVGRGLYETEPVFREAIDRGAVLLEPELDLDLRRVLYPDPASERDREAAATRLQETAIAQPALFVLEHALATLWMRLGVTPRALAGHSIGEYVAACIAGVFSFEEGLSLVAARGRLMQRTAPGAMLSIAAPAADVHAVLQSGVSVAAINAPALTVVSGPVAGVQAIEAVFVERGIECRRLDVAFGFHSALMDPVLAEFGARLRAVTLAPPRIPVVSNLTGTWLTAAQACDPGYWTEHLRRTVRFMDGVRELLAMPDPVLIEIGPGRALAQAAAATRASETRADSGAAAVIATTRHRRETRPDVAVWLGAIGEAWQSGVPIDWEAFAAGEDRRRVPLPTYPFERERYWVDPVGTRRGGTPAREPSRRLPLDRWFYAPLWRQAPLSANLERMAGSRWLLVGGGETANRIATLARSRGATVAVVGRVDDVSAAIGGHHAPGTPWQVVDLEGVPTLSRPVPGSDPEDGFNRLIALTQALTSDPSREIRLVVVASESQQVEGREALRPERAMLAGAVTVIAQEHPSLRCRAIDVAAARLDVDALVAEIVSDAGDLVVSYRGTERWVPEVEAVALAATRESSLRSAQIRPKGTYLITGGFGGIGLVAAETLVSAGASNLVLIGRTASASRSAVVQSLEAKGARVLALVADVGTRHGLARVLDEARRRFGRIDGVVHAAGVADGALIARRTPAMSADVLGPKVRGTLLLEDLLADDPPDFVVLCSALASVLGGAGQVAYCAANAFLDAFARSRSLGGADVVASTRWIAVGWDAWRDVGMAVAGAVADGAIRLSAAGDWRLDEHRIAGAGVLPGTAYLELALQAEWGSDPGTGRLKVGIEIREVYFLSPCVCEDGESRELRTVLSPPLDAQPGARAFVVESRRATGAAGSSRAPWQEHCRGLIATTGDAAAARSINLASIAARITTSVARPLDERRLAPFGPRWRNVVETMFSEDEALLTLELPEAYADNLASHPLHPALMDIATGLMSLRDGRDEALPFSYERVRIHAPLPRRIVSHIRRAGATTGDARATSDAAYDVTIADPDGRVLVDIEHYALRRARAENFTVTMPATGGLDQIQTIPAERRAPGPGEVEIEVGAAGLNFKEVLLALGMLPGAGGRPHAFGLECAGTVARVGPEVARFAPGDRVIAFASGAFAHYVVTPAASVALMPRGLSAEEAATIPATYLTAYYALVQLARLRKGDRVLLHAAATGVGLAGVMVARWVGAEIFATAGTPEKRDYLRSLGVAQIMDSRSLDFADEVMARTKGAGVDVVMNALSGEFITRNLSVLANHGRYLELGVRDIYEDKPLPLGVFRKGLSFFAVSLGPDVPGFEALFAGVVDRFNDGDLAPLPRRVFPVARIGDAFECMAQARHIGKVVVSIAPDASRAPATFADDEFLANGIRSAEGAEVLLRVLTSDRPQIMVSTCDLSARLRRPHPMADETRRTDASGSRHARPQLDTPYVAPRSATERLVADVWGELLGIADVGVRDSFFDLGGDSLQAARIVSRLHKVAAAPVPLSAFLQHPTVEDLAARVDDRRRSSELAPIPRLPDAAFHELSHAQRRLWVLSQLGDASPAYNVPLHQLVEGPLDEDALERAFHLVIDRHESLRTRFMSVEGVPWQQVMPRVDFVLGREDVSRAADPEAAAHALAEAHARAPFDLDRAPLLRASVIRIADRRHVVLLTLHHVIADGISFNVLARELSAAYDAVRAGRTPALPPLPVQYRDFAAWQNALVDSEAVAGHRDYWQRKLSGTLPSLDLPTDAVRPRLQSFDGREHRFSLDAALTGRLVDLGRRSQASLFMTLVALVKALLHRYTAQADIIVGTPIAGRTHPDLEDQIGYYLNMLALRDEVDGDAPFDDLLEQVRQTATEAYDHQDYPFDRLVDEVLVERDLSRSPLFDVVVILQNQEEQGLAFAGAETSAFFGHSGTSKYDLTFSFKQLPDRLLCGIEYDTALFAHDRIERMASHFVELASAAATDSATAVGRLNLLPPRERDAVVSACGAAPTSCPPAGSEDPAYVSRLTVVDLFEAQARRAPYAAAAADGGRTLTYAELDRRANAAARWLGSRGAAHGARVGISVDRRADMVAVMLGVLKTGAAYVPIDPHLPEERRAFMIRDADVQLVVTDAEVAEMTADADNAADAPAWHAPAPGRPALEDLAYVIYTSGSTGTPKGVAIPHGALANFLLSMAQRPGITEDDVVVAVTTLSFDIAALELLLPLTVGARVVVASREDAADGRRLAALLDASGATVMQGTPATWRLLIEAGWAGRKHLKILCGGEALARPLADALLVRGREVWNLYGPTETTIWSAVRRIGGDESAGGNVPIGRPIANTRIYILDRWLQPAPIGVPGEICIGGDGVASGYVARPELTAERFVADPFRPGAGARMYRTGDIGILRPDGDIECLGRTDHQVKVRGFRIELGEVEAALAAVPGVTQAAALAEREPSGDNVLVAYVAGSAGQQELRRALAERLPDYMVPSRVTIVDRLPLGPSGKVDRRALAARARATTAAREMVAPRDEIERTIASVWEEVLGVDRVGVHDDFFELGGHSLKATRARFQIERALGVTLTLPDVFRHPTVESLAALVRQRPADNASMPSIVAPPTAEELELLGD